MLNVDKLSYWERKTFFENIDFLIIGSGIVGYSTALHLRKIKPESKVVIIERGYLPSGASSKNAGFACFGSATELFDDIQNFGEKLVWETVSLRWKGLQYLRSIVGDDNLKLEINGSWDLITNRDLSIFEKVKNQIDYFNEEIEKITGESNVYSIDDQVGDKFGFDSIHTSFFNRLEGQIDTASMNTKFHQLAIENDIHVLFGIEATSISNTAVQTNVGEIEANKIAICTNGFAKNLLPEFDINPARAQVLITKPIPELRFEGTFHYQEGYYYFRNIDNRVLFGGGRNIDFEGETTEELSTSDNITSRLETILKEVILPNTSYEIDYTWAGIMGVGNDKKPIIKEVDNGVYCGVRLGGMGVAIGTLVGKELCDLMAS